MPRRLAGLGAAGRILVAAVLLLLGCAASSAEEAVERFAAEITLLPDGTVRATETIRVRGEGDIIRRGIFRDVSTTFEDADGAVRRVGFRLLGVVRDGKPEPHFTERHADFIRIYAGQEDVLLDPGVYTYTFQYETDRQVRWIEGKPELFWNVTGNGWTFPIEQASARLRVAGGAAPIAWDAYTGALGARGKEWRGSVGADGALSIATTRALLPGEGLTLVAALPANAVERPGAAAELRYFLYDHLHWIIGGAALFGVLAYYLFAWDKVGRDPEGGTIIPLFHPPNGISPALAGYIRNWGLSGRRSYRAFTAAALALAVRGLLVFDQEGANLVLERTDTAAEATTALPANEAALLRWVEAQGGRAEISQAHSTAVQEMEKAFRASVEAESGGRHFKHNLPYVIGGLVLSALGLGAIVLFGGFSEEDISLLFGLVTFGILVGIFVVPAIGSTVEKARAGSLFGGIFSLVVIVGLVIYFGADFLPDLAGGRLAATLRNHAFVFAVALAFPLVNGLFYYLLRAPTREGRPVMDQLEGLRMYLDTAESGRLNIADAPDLTTERFEALLPYAVALDVERPWANAFAAALARAHPDDPDPHYRPRWRRGGSGGSVSDLGRSIGSAVSGATSAMQSALPRSSSGSSGFGGGSGGGGGGRGGGGW